MLNFCYSFSSSLLFLFLSTDTCATEFFTIWILYANERPFKRHLIIVTEQVYLSDKRRVAVVALFSANVIDILLQKNTLRKNNCISLFFCSFFQIDRYRSNGYGILLDLELTWIWTLSILFSLFIDPFVSNAHTEMDARANIFLRHWSLMLQWPQD